MTEPDRAGRPEPARWHDRPGRTPTRRPARRAPARPARWRAALTAVRSLLAGRVLAAPLLVLSATPAAAHAVLVSASPADGAQLDEAPEVVRLTFNEPVSADLGDLRVFARDGSRVDEGAVRVDGPVVEVDLRGDLPDGSYVASYRVVSADSHPVRGALVFAVGDADLAADRDALAGLVGDGDDGAWEVAGAVARWVGYGGVLVAAGGAAFLALVHRTRSAERPALVRLTLVAAGAGAVGVLATVPVQAALATGQGPRSLVQSGVAGSVLADGVGLGVALAVAGLVALGAGLLLAGAAGPVVALGGAAVAAASFATTGHNRSSDVAALATGATVVHLWAAAIWLGGLALVWLTLRRRGRDDAADPATTGAVVGRFSTVAALSVVGVALAGTALTWSEVRSLDALTSTTYGALLLAKVGVVAAVLAVASYNNRVLVPAVVAGRGRAAARLASTIRFEGVLLALALAVTAVLVNETPARSEAESGGIEERVLELPGAGSVQVVIDPARVGPIEVHLYTYDDQGFPDEIAEELTLELVQRDEDVGPLHREPYRAGPAHFQLDGTAFPIPGTWEVTVRARVDRFTEATALTEVEVTP